MMNKRFTDDSEEEFSPDEPRSIFAALWFRVVIGVAALGVISAVAVPYVLDWTRPPIVIEKATLAAATSAPTAGAPPSPPPARDPAPSSVPETAKPLAAAPGVPAAMSSTTSPPTAPQAPVSTGVQPGKAPAVTPSAPLPVAAAVTTDIKPTAEEPVAPRSAEPVAKASTARTEKATTRMTGEAGAGTYWVQVGAYRDAATAERLAARLRELGYHVSEVGPAPAAAAAPVESSAMTPAAEPAAPGGDKYDVVVSGAPAAKITERLVGKGLVADVTATGVVVKPPIPLPEAVALSRELAADGLRVQVRRAGAAVAKPAPTRTSAVPTTSDGLHRVRVGAYPDRTTALAAARELSGKGYEGFVARSAP